MLFYKTKLRDLFHAVFNLTIFLPYYFSVPVLIKTLFSPWRNMIDKKRPSVLNLNAWFASSSFNLISRMIGCVMRISLLIIYIFLQILFVLFIPIVIVFYLLILPLFFLISLLTETPKNKKNKLKSEFVKKHLLKVENQQKVEAWFEIFYTKAQQKKIWWSLNNLFVQPPLARDWSVGYTYNLDKYCEELTSVQYQEKTKNIIDREKEIKQIELVFLKSEGANVLISGDEGIGKHTIVDAFAKKIYEGKINPLLAYKRVLKLNLEKILSEYTDQKKREDFLQELFLEASDAKNIILLIENFDKYLDNLDDHVNLSIIIEKFGKLNNLQIIGLTTPFAYHKYIFPHAKINQLFNKIDVYEVDRFAAEQILLSNSFYYENHYQINIPYETIQNILEKSNFYITNIPFPEKAIDLLDLACVYTKEAKAEFIHPEIIDKVITEKTHIATSLTKDLKQKLINLESLLSTKIINQDDALHNLASALRRSYLLFNKRKKPLASFLFLGPTGVGKTETAKAVQQVFFGTDSNMIRFDMSLYQSKNDIPKLIGSNETKETGLLTENIRQKPYGVFLLDEIDKADRELLNIFLTVLDEGYFTDGYGKRVDCKNLIIIATSNAGIDYIQHFFSPEFLNRFDGVIVYNPLNQEAIIKIARKMIENISQDIFKLYKVKLIVSDNLLTDLVQKGYDEKFGARNMERLIRDQIEDKVSRMILENKIKENETINL